MSDLSRKYNPIESGVMHSSGFANIADGNTASFGAASPETFAQRMHIEHNRQHVQGFRNAGVLHGYRQEARSSPVGNRQGANISQLSVPQQSLHSGNRTSVGHVDSGLSRQSYNARNNSRLAVPTRFHEPTSRHFNPYQ